MPVQQAVERGVCTSLSKDMVSRVDEAEVYWRAASDMGHAGAWYCMGNLLNKRKGDMAGAEKAYRECLKIVPSYPHARFGLGAMLEGRGDIAGAEKAYRECLKIDPSQTGARYNLGRLLNQRGDKAGAEKAYRECLKIDPRHIDARCNLGGLLAEKGDMAGAEKAYRECLKIDPSFTSAMINLPQIFLYEKRNYDQAERLLRKALKLLPPNHPHADSVRQNLSYCLRQKANPAEH